MSRYFNPHLGTAGPTAGAAEQYLADPHVYEEDRQLAAKRITRFDEWDSKIPDMLGVRDLEPVKLRSVGGVPA